MRYFFLTLKEISFFDFIKIRTFVALPLIAWGYIFSDRSKFWLGILLLVTIFGDKFAEITKQEKE